MVQPPVSATGSGSDSDTGTPRGASAEQDNAAGWALFNDWADEEYKHTRNKPLAERIAEWREDHLNVWEGRVPSKRKLSRHIRTRFNPPQPHGAQAGTDPVTAQQPALGSAAGGSASGSQPAVPAVQQATAASPAAPKAAHAGPDSKTDTHTHSPPMPPPSHPPAPAPNDLGTQSSPSPAQQHKRQVSPQRSDQQPPQDASDAQVASSASPAQLLGRDAGGTSAGTADTEPQSSPQAAAEAQGTSASKKARMENEQQHVSVMGAVPTLDLSKPAMVAAAGSPTAGSHPPEAGVSAGIQPASAQLPPVLHLGGPSAQPAPTHTSLPPATSSAPGQRSFALPASALQASSTHVPGAAAGSTLQWTAPGQVTMQQAGTGSPGPIKLALNLDEELQRLRAARAARPRHEDDDFAMPLGEEKTYEEIVAATLGNTGVVPDAFTHLASGPSSAAQVASQVPGAAASYSLLLTDLRDPVIVHPQPVSVVTPVLLSSSIELQHMVEHGAKPGGPCADPHKPAHTSAAGEEEGVIGEDD